MNEMEKKVTVYVVEALEQKKVYVSKSKAALAANALKDFGVEAVVAPEKRTVKIS